MKKYLPSKKIFSSQSKSNYYIKNKVREKFKDLFGMPTKKEKDRIRNARRIF